MSSATKTPSSFTASGKASKSANALEAAKAYLAAPSPRQILDAYRTSPYLKLTGEYYPGSRASALASGDVSRIANVPSTHNEADEATLSALSPADVFEIHHMLNEKTWVPDVVQWDETKPQPRGEYVPKPGSGARKKAWKAWKRKVKQAHEVPGTGHHLNSTHYKHFITSEEVAQLGKCFNTSKLDKTLWAQAVLGLEYDVVKRLLKAARKLAKAKKRRSKVVKIAKKNAAKKRVQEERRLKEEERKRRKDAGRGRDSTGDDVEETEQVDHTTTIDQGESAQDWAQAPGNLADSTTEMPQHNELVDLTSLDAGATEGSVTPTDTPSSSITTATHEEEGTTSTVSPHNAALSDSRVSEDTGFKRKWNNVIDLEDYEQPEEDTPAIPHDEASNSSGKRQASGGKRQRLSHESLRVDKVHVQEDEHANEDLDESSLRPACLPLRSASSSSQPLPIDAFQNDIVHEPPAAMIVPLSIVGPEVPVTPQTIVDHTATTFACSNQTATPTSTPLTTRSPFTITTNLTTRSKPRTRSTPLKSPYFAPPKPTPSPRPKAGTSSLPFPPLSSPAFGLIQERLAHNPFQLLVAVMFLNKTRGIVALPVIEKVLARWPTPEMMAAIRLADDEVVENSGNTTSNGTIEELTAMIKNLGLQNQRARNLVRMARTWLQNPPTRGRRYRTLNYPWKGAGKGVKVIGDEDDDDVVEDVEKGVVEEDEEDAPEGVASGRVKRKVQEAEGEAFHSTPIPNSSQSMEKSGATDIHRNQIKNKNKVLGAFEIAHLPGIGAYALDSWRIFYRDVLRGVASGWDGEGAADPAVGAAVADDLRAREEALHDDASAHTSTLSQLPPNSTALDLQKWAETVVIPSSQTTASSLSLSLSPPPSPSPPSPPSSSNQRHQTPPSHSQPQRPVFEPEWQRVLPQDKELRAFLRWMWLKKYGLHWDPETGRTWKATKEFMESVGTGGGMCLQVVEVSEEGDGDGLEVGDGSLMAEVDDENDGRVEVVAKPLTPRTLRATRSHAPRSDLAGTVAAAHSSEHEVEYSSPQPPAASQSSSLVILKQEDSSLPITPPTSASSPPSAASRSSSRRRSQTGSGSQEAVTEEKTRKRKYVRSGLYTKAALAERRASKRRSLVKAEGLDD